MVIPADPTRLLSALRNIFALDRSSTTFLQFAQGLRDVIGEFFLSFEYEIWLHDKFEDKRSHLFLSAYRSKGSPGRVTFNTRTRTGPVANSFFNDEVITESQPDGVSLYSPIAFGSERLGVVAVHLVDRSEVMESTATALRYLGEHLFLAFEHFFQSLENRLFVRVREIILKGGRTHREIVSDLLLSLMEVVPCEGCSLFLYDPDSKRLYLGATTGLFRRSAERYTYESGEGLTGWVAKHGKALRLYNIDDQSEIKAVADDLVWKSKFSEIPDSEIVDYSDWRSFLAVPVFTRPAQNKLLGVLRLSKRSYGDAFFPSEEKLVSDFAKFLTTYYYGYRNKCLGDDLEFVGSMGRALAAPQADLKDLAFRVLKYFSEMTQTEDGYVALLNADEISYSTFTQYGTPLEERSDIKLLGEGLVGIAAERKRVIFINDPGDRDLLGIKPPKSSAVDGVILSQIAIPLIFKDTVIGVVNLHSQKRDIFTPLHRKRLALTAEAAAVIVAYAKRYQSVFLRLESVTKVLESFGDFFSNADLQRVYKVVLAECVKLLAADSAALLLFDRDRGSLRVEEVFDYDFLSRDFEVKVGTGVSGASFARGEIVSWRKDEDGVSDVKSIEVDPSLLSEIGIPVVYRGERLGCVVVGSTRSRYLNVSEEIKSVVILLAQQVGLALTTARLLTERAVVDRARNRLERSVTIGSFVTSIAHDFHNRLLTIKGDLGLVERGVSRDADVGGRRLGEIIDSIEKNVDLLNDMTTKLKKQKADVPYKIVDCYLNEIVEQAISILRFYASEKRVDLEVILAESLGRPKQGRGHPFVADFDSISRAVENIVKNAIEHSRARQKVKIETVYVKPKSRYEYRRGEVRIVDYGEGISEVNRSHVFEPGFTTKSDGSGLGLFNARSAIQAAGGRIGFDSGGKGTTFTVSFYLE